jgi:hypothetical protein
MTEVCAPEKQWLIQKTKLKRIFHNLNEHDFWYDYGQKEVMMMKLQVKLNLNRQTLNRLLAELTKE